MMAGREQARARRRRIAIVTVRDYRRWLLEGSRRGTMPPVPSDAQYAAARAAGECYSVLDMPK